jgi:hypothetical protein
MFGILFSIVVVICLLSMCGEVAMRVRLTYRDAGDRMGWWRRGGDEVASTYAQLFPTSYLPSYRRFAYWFIVTCAALLLSMFWYRSSGHTN